VDADGESHHIKEEYDPFVGARLVGMVLPFEDGPEYQGGEEGGRGVYFAFDGAVPKGVAEGIGQGAYDTGAHDGEQLAFIGFGRSILTLNELAGEVRDGPEQEEDGQTAGNGAHEVDAAGGGMRTVAEKDDKEAAHEDEEGGAWGVGDLELVAAGYEFTAIPEAAGRFHGHDKYGTSDYSHDPAHDIVHSVKTHKNLDFNGQTGLIDFQRRLRTFGWQRTRF